MNGGNKQNKTKIEKKIEIEIEILVDETQFQL